MLDSWEEYRNRFILCEGTDRELLEKVFKDGFTAGYRWLSFLNSEAKKEKAK
jgi:hypothetical protein